MLPQLIVGFLLATGLTLAVTVDDCPGYKASNVDRGDYYLTADLTLAGEACNVYGDDLQDLKLLVEYQTGKHLGSFSHYLHPAGFSADIKQTRDFMSKSTT